MGLARGQGLGASKTCLGHLLQGSEKVDGIALFVRVGDELGIQLLVAGKADASSLVVGILWGNSLLQPTLPPHSWNSICRDTRAA